MLLSGVQTLTLLDYPGQVAAIAFTAGCNFRCGYCHNPEFVLPERLVKLKADFIPVEVFLKFLKARQDLLTGVVVSGGEPTIQPDLLTFIRSIKDLGFLVKLDTNGSQPETIKKILADNLVDYFALDVKTSAESYAGLVKSKIAAEKIKMSAELIKNSDVDYEFRATLIKQIHSDKTLAQMHHIINGARRLYLQTFRPLVTLDPAFAKYQSFSTEEMTAIAQRFADVVKEVAIRSN